MESSVVSDYAQILLLVSVCVQVVSMFAGRFFYTYAFQREAISFTCGFAALSAGTYTTNSYFIWIMLFGFAFSLVYYLTPRLIGERSNIDAKPPFVDKDDEVNNGDV